MKNIIVLGSTGSIGRQTLDIVRAFPKELNLIGLAAGNNVALLDEQINEFAPSYYYSQKSYTPSNKSSKYCSIEDMVSIHEVDLVMVFNGRVITTMKFAERKLRLGINGINIMRLRL